MLTDAETLRRLRAAGRHSARPVERRLRCPDCRGDVVLRDGLYHCAPSLAEGLPAPPIGPASEDGGPAGLAKLAVGEVVKRG